PVAWAAWTSSPQEPEVWHTRPRPRRPGGSLRGPPGFVVPRAGVLVPGRTRICPESAERGQRELWLGEEGRPSALGSCIEFFSVNLLLLRQPKKFWSWNSEYHCFDPYGRQVAHVHQDTSDSGSRFFQQWMTGSSQSKVFVRDAWGHVRLVIQKHWALMTATTHVLRPDGRPVGTIEQDFSFFKSGFTLFDPWKRRVGTIEGDFFARDFRISD